MKRLLHDERSPERTGVDVGDRLLEMNERVAEPNSMCLITRPDRSSLGASARGGLRRLIRRCGQACSCVQGGQPYGQPY